MSGPKVVRIVTPEERRIIKSRWLTRLKHKVESIKSYAQKQGVLDEELEKGLDEMLAHYEGISENEYEKIEREVPAQIQYLEAEKTKLVKKVSKERTSTWERYQKAKSTHSELLRLLKEKNIPYEDIETPSRITGATVSDYQQQIDTLYETLKKGMTESKGLTAEQKEIQARLYADDHLLTVQEWSTEKPKEVSRLQKFEQTLKELYVDDLSQDKIQELLRRSGELKRNDPKYTMLLDSLILEAATFHKEQTELKAVKEALSERLKELRTLNAELSVLETWETLLETDKTLEIQEAVEKAKRLYEEISENIIVETRRAAIKKALTKAGYEVNDSMETAWVENGRLVVKKAENSLYGVEFMSPKNLARIQARVVADEDRSAERSPSLDKHQEEIWCDEFDDIREVLESENLSIRVDKMEAAGSIPIKEVKLDSGFKQNKQSIKKRRTL